ncbi:MAG: GNAT family N-acetyltransferase [Oscillospiraceae bacterium]|nr:GNAT family N-acetyltransferase [Oscillospiraceae bacterium]
MKGMVIAMITTNKITFEKFTEKHIDEAVKLALAELEAERTHCPDLPCEDFSQHLTGILQWLSDQPFGKAAMCDEKLVGYLIFAGPWDGFFGDVKGVFSPLGGSAFSYEYENRGRLASMLFASVAEEFVKQNVFSCALSRYAHDEEAAKSFILNGFGIRCSDFVRELSEFDSQTNSYNAVFKELSADEFKAVEQLQRGLHKHLAGAPAFYPSDDFDEWFENWIKSDSMRIFAAEADGRIIGFISTDDTAENFITEHDKMKNICGAYFDENYRSNGIAQGLLAFIADTLKAEGVTHLGVDCETLNPTALNFWGKYFEPYTYSFARRIDERIKM